jgi:four helix bundle protein
MCNLVAGCQIPVTGLSCNMKSYRDPELYKISKRLAVEIHKMTLTLPKFELFEEGGQKRFSSKSVTAMIVEGYGRRRYKAEFILYLVFSQSECDETMVHLDFLFETKSLDNESLYNDQKSEYDLLSKRINKFIQWVEENFNNQYTGNQ